MVYKTISIVPKVILGVHRSIIQESILTSQNDLIPQYNLIQFVIRSLVLSRKIQEQLLYVPIKQGIEISLRHDDGGRQITDATEPAGQM